MSLPSGTRQRPPQSGFVLTGKPEVIGSSVGLAPINALMTTEGALSNAFVMALDAIFMAKSKGKRPPNGWKRQNG